MQLEEVLYKVLFGINMFYPLLIISVIVSVFAITRRSSVWMLIGGILLLPSGLYLIYFGSPFHYAIIIPLIQLALAVIFYRIKSKG